MGYALRTPLGRDADAVMARLFEGHRAARANARFDASAYACHLAATIDEPPRASRNARFVRRMGLYGIEAAAEALAHAKGATGDRVGLFSGVGGLRAHWDDMMHAFARQESDGVDAWERGLKDIHPFWMLQHLSNNAHALIAKDLGLRGEGATFGGSNGGAQALAAAERALADGAVDAALVVAYDSLSEPETLVELGANGTATTATLGSLRAPYEPGAAGVVPGEAAAALYLVAEGREHTAPHAWLDVSDAADGERGVPQVETLARLAATWRDGVGFVDGAARANERFDRAEREALGALVGGDTPLVATLGAMGDLGAASSLVQAIACARLLHARELPPIAGLTDVVDGPLRPLRTRETTTARAALALACGAPGLAAAVRVRVG